MRVGERRGHVSLLVARGGKGGGEGVGAIVCCDELHDSGRDGGRESSVASCRGLPVGGVNEESGRWYGYMSWGARQGQN